MAKELSFILGDRIGIMAVGDRTIINENRETRFWRSTEFLKAYIGGEFIVFPLNL